MALMQCTISCVPGTTSALQRDARIAHDTYELLVLSHVNQHVDKCFQQCRQRSDESLHRLLGRSIFVVMALRDLNVK